MVPQHPHQSCSAARWHKLWLTNLGNSNRNSKSAATSQCHCITLYPGETKPFFRMKWLKAPNFQEMKNHLYSSLLYSAGNHKFFQEPIWVEEKGHITFRTVVWSFMRSIHILCLSDMWIMAWGYPPKLLKAVPTLVLMVQFVMFLNTLGILSQSHSLLGVCQVHLADTQSHQWSLHQPEVGIMCCCARYCALSQ